MKNILEVLNNSFEMLFDRPQLFVPRLISSTISSALLIGWVAGAITTIQFLAFFPVVAIIGGFTPVMVSSMVKNDEEEILRKGLDDALALWKPVIGLTVFTGFLAFLNSLPLSIGLMLTQLTGNMLYLGVGGVISLVMLLAISFGLYFVPISIVENRGFLKSLQDGISTSNRNRSEVVALTLFSLTVLAASSAVTGYLRDIGFTVFFLGRIASSIVGTYLLVISPNYYLEEKQQ